MGSWDTWCYHAGVCACSAHDIWHLTHTRSHTRWRHAQLPAAAVVARVLEAAGMAESGAGGEATSSTEEAAAREKALGALVGDGGAPVPIAQQVCGSLAHTHA